METRTESETALLHLLSADQTDQMGSSGTRRRWRDVDGSSFIDYGWYFRDQSHGTFAKFSYLLRSHSCVFQGEVPLYTYSIVTVAASKTLEWMHDRMPALLDGDEAVDMWLDSVNVPLEEV